MSAEDYAYINIFIRHQQAPSTDNRNLHPSTFFKGSNNRSILGPIISGRLPDSMWPSP